MNRLIRWAASGIMITLIFGTIYTVSQQSVRQQANNPQIQLAEDTANALNNDNSPASLVSGNIKINDSLAPFIIIYDKQGRVVVGNGYLNGKVPIIPYGALTHATPGKDNWVTWEPINGVRLASVEVAANNYYVLSGRSMREVEKTETFLLQDTVMGYVVALLVLLAVIVMTDLPPRRIKKTTIHKK